MTRDEAKQNLYYGLQFGILKPNIFIDSIYDEFEKEKEELIQKIEASKAYFDLKIDGNFLDEK